jgi:hypothetical protein
VDLWRFHPDRLLEGKIRNGRLAIGSLKGAGFASGAYPDWAALRPLAVLPPASQPARRISGA